MQLIYKSVSLASVIYEFDLNEAYLLLVQGMFGGDFIRFGQYFSAHGVYSKGTFSYYYDNESGMYYLQSRYYNPELCRFISADDPSYHRDFSNITAANLYVYANNDPIKYTDYDGRDVLSPYPGYYIQYNPSCYDENVKSIQQQLVNVYDYDLEVDGYFGPITQTAVMDFQDNHPACGGADGIVGPKTWAVMFSVPDPENGNQDSDPEYQDQTIHIIIPNPDIPATDTTPTTPTNSNWKTEMSFWDYIFSAKQMITTNSNMDYNSKINVSGCINGQDTDIWANMRFGGDRIGHSGCEVIAVYNAMQLLRKSVSFASVIYEFDLNEAYLLRVMGFFGGDYMRFGNYFSAHGVSSEGTSNPDTLISGPKRKGIYIISFWIESDIFKGIHTVAMKYRNGSYFVYNIDNNASKEYPVTSFSELYESVGGSFIYGWSVY